jgi:hypothetical protein
MHKQLVTALAAAHLDETRGLELSDNFAPRHEDIVT